MKVSVVGLGIMGAAMASRLLESGHTVTVTNRTKAKAALLLEAGAVWADSPASATDGADVVITMVTNPAAVSEVSLGPSGILSAISESAVHSEMSTVAPDSTITVASTYRSAGRRFVQAPVLGSRQQIEQTALLVVAGGDSADIDHCRPAWSAFAKRIWTLEKPEQASALKLACNMMIAQMILALGQSMTLAKLYGIAPSTVIDVIGESALASPMYRSKGQSIVEGRFTPNFVVDNLLKDVTLAGAAANAKGAELAMNALAREIFVRASEAGFGGEDYSAVVKILAKDAGVMLTPE